MNMLASCVFLLNAFDTFMKIKGLVHSKIKFVIIFSTWGSEQKILYF